MGIGDVYVCKIAVTPYTHTYTHTTHTRTPYNSGRYVFQFLTQSTCDLAPASRGPSTASAVTELI
jgi:hypothetical protein